MSFRRNKASALAWQQWLLANREELLACGVPPTVLEEERHWTYFLEHGYFTPPGIASPIIDVDRLDSSLAKRLCIFLEGTTYYPGSSALNRLQCLLGRGPHSGNAGSSRANAIAMLQELQTAGEGLAAVAAEAYLKEVREDRKERKRQ
jgi:hypothetical protein